MENNTYYLRYEASCKQLINSGMWGNNNIEVNTGLEENYNIEILIQNDLKVGIISQLQQDEKHLESHLVN